MERINNNSGNLVTIERELSDIQQEILDGLQAERKYISSKFFYNQKGSELFQQITELEEYYPTRTEMSILMGHGREISELLVGKTVIELGSGDASKIGRIFEHLDSQSLSNCLYCPVDVSQQAVDVTAQAIQKRFPKVSVQGIVADFIHHLDQVQVDSPKIICFFGSTIGNFTLPETRQILRNIASLMNQEDLLLLGVDRTKDIGVIQRAYNDPKGVTSAFNKNILNHVNDLIDGDFNPQYFDHHAVYNQTEERIEMYLVSNRDHDLKTPLLPDPIRISSGEMIHTENSHKYSDQGIKKLLTHSTLSLVSSFSDSNNYFSLMLLRV